MRDYIEMKRLRGGGKNYQVFDLNFHRDVSKIGRERVFSHSPNFPRGDKKTLITKTKKQFISKTGAIWICGHPPHQSPPPPIWALLVWATFMRRWVC